MTDTVADASQVRVKYVKFTNNLDVEFSDRHDGVPLRVGPGEIKNVPLDSAAHMFGYVPGVSNEQMMKHISKRQGWNTPKFLQEDESHKTLAQRMFEKLDIRPVMYKLVQIEADPTAPIAADPDPEADEPSRGPRRVAVKA